jgi:hypothetical protein
VSAPLKVSVEVSPDGDAWKYALVSNTRRPWVINSVGQKDEADRQAALWRSALSAINGELHDIEGMKPEFVQIDEPIRWCARHHDFVLTELGSGGSATYCPFAAKNPDIAYTEPCQLEPVYTRKALE